MNASNLPLSKTRQFLHSEILYTKSTPVKRKFKNLKAFTSFTDEIWYVDLAYLDELAKVNIVVRYLLVRQDLEDTAMVGKRIRTRKIKIFQSNCSCIFNYSHKKEPIQERKFGSARKEYFQRSVKKFAKHLQKTDQKVAFDDRSMRSSKT